MIAWEAPDSPACSAVADADCRVWLRASPRAPRQELPRCSSEVFGSHAASCAPGGASPCPCWRVVPRPKICGAELGVAPYGLDLVGVETGPDGVLELACALADAGACS